MTLFQANKNVLLLPQKMTAEYDVLQCVPGWFAVPTANRMWPHVQVSKNLVNVCDILMETRLVLELPQ